MNARSTARAAGGDVVVQLDTPDELFTVDTHRLLTGTGRLSSGIEELLDRFVTQKKVRPGQRIVLEFLATETSPELAETMTSVIRRYCALEIDRTGRERDLTWRQGMRSMVGGGALFVLGIVLSFLFTRPAESDFWRLLLGDGVFLVVAWVGLWYPLDLLFMARQPLKRKMRILAEMSVLPVLVRTPTTISGLPPPAAAPPPTTPQPPPA